jgi:predicted transcriptional regulator
MKSSATLVTLVLVLFAAVLSAEPVGPAAVAGLSSVSALDKISGTQAFPPAGLSREGNATALAAWFGDKLRLNITGGGLTDTSVTWIGDAFNRSISYRIDTYEYTAPSAGLLRIQYSADTGWFISFDVRFSTLRQVGQQSLRNYSSSIASALGVSALNASYVEVSTTLYEPNPNGTAAVPHIYRTGEWREVRGGMEVNFANQLQVAEDTKLGAVYFIRGHPWFAGLPALGFSEKQIVEAASQIVNTALGGHGTPSYSVLGITPNQVNLTWSFVVELGYVDSGVYVLLLNAETLAFQRLVLWTKAGPSDQPRPIASVLFLLAVIIASAALLATIGLAWFGYTDASWALASVSLLVPLIARLKRESVLDHFLRGRIVEHVTSNPGVTFAQLKGKFGVANGVLSYHLWILSKTGFIRPQQEGPHVRYFPVGFVGHGPTLLSSFQYSVLRVVFAHKGARIQELSRELGCSKQRIHYNVKQLARNQLLELVNRGGDLVVTLSEHGMELVRQVDHSTSERETPAAEPTATGRL